MVGKAPDFGGVQYGKKIGEKIRKFRKDKGLTLEGLESELRSIGLTMSFKVLSRLENGSRPNTALHELDAIAFALGVKIEDLWTPVVGWKE